MTDPPPFTTEPRFVPSPLAPRRTPEEQSRDRDLGFGAVVGRASRGRLLNRDGSFNVARSGLGIVEAFGPYRLLRASWWGFLGLVGLLYLTLNLLLPLAWRAASVAGGARRGDAGRTVQPGVLLQHSDLRDD